MSGALDSGTSCCNTVVWLRVDIRLPLWMRPMSVGLDCDVDCGRDDCDSCDDCDAIADAAASCRISLSCRSFCRLISMSSYVSNMCTDSTLYFPLLRLSLNSANWVWVIDFLFFFGG